MLLNSKRQTVWKWLQEPPSEREAPTCPDCGKDLVARQCELRISHFAHYPLRDGAKRSCKHEETEWHLGWKFAFLELPGWEVEVRLEDGAYRADAYHAGGKRVREFVHSLSPYYMAKHRALREANYDVFWLIDGHAFESARLEEFTCRNETPGIRYLLKPKAVDLVRELVPHVKVHYKGAIWQPGNDLRYWFRADGPDIRHLLGLWEKYAKMQT